jgi:hypothetical protein
MLKYLTLQFKLLRQDFLTQGKDVSKEFQRIFLMQGLSEGFL